MKREYVDDIGEDESEQFQECPECGGHMKSVIDTMAKMTGDSEDDNTNLLEWWECIDCGYYK
jgi:uncharacterized protein with PIN domain